MAVRQLPEIRGIFLVGGGEKGIRTLETVTRLHTFQACAFDHSAISPHWAAAGLPASKALPREAADGVREICAAIDTGLEKDERTITLAWYRHLEALRAQVAALELHGGMLRL